MVKLTAAQWRELREIVSKDGHYTCSEDYIPVRNLEKLGMIEFNYLGFGKIVCRATAKGRAAHAARSSE